MSGNQPVLTSLDALSVGRTGSNPFVINFAARAPTINDTEFPIQKWWYDTADETLYLLENYTSSNNLLFANWVSIGGSFVTESLTGNTGGAVFPTANNINVVGDGVYITTVGDPATSTLTIEPGGGLTTLYTENTGTATPMSGNLNVLGAGGITTVGSGNTITISAGPTVATTYVENTGSAIPALNILNIVGGSGITTSGAGNTVTITNTSTGITWLDESTSFAAAVSTGYFVIGNATATLPAAPVQGNMIPFVVDGAFTLTITANTGQKIKLGAALSASAGTAVNNATGDSVTLVFRASDSTWIATSIIGTWTVT